VTTATTVTSQSRDLVAAVRRELRKGGLYADRVAVRRGSLVTARVFGTPKRIDAFRSAHDARVRELEYTVALEVRWERR
jgi:hypothetical protein